MIGFIGSSGAWILQQAATLPETLMVRQVAAERGWFEQVAAVASVLMTLTLLVLAVFLVPAAWNFRTSYKKATAILDRMQADIDPIIRHASSIADNVDYVTTTVRTDVQRINATVAAANQRIQEAVALTETRLNEFNALLEVVQEEAEDLFISTAATVRGVRRGAERLGRDVGPELASFRQSAADTATARENENMEDSDGNDDDIGGGPRAGTGPGPAAATPRRRPRTSPRERS